MRINSLINIAIDALQHILYNQKLIMMKLDGQEVDSMWVQSRIQTTEAVCNLLESEKA